MSRSIRFILLGSACMLIGIFGFMQFGSNDNEPELVMEEEKTTEEKRDIETTLVAGGDVMMSRHVGTKMREYGDDALSFRKIYNIFSGADISFVNLESPFYDQGDYVTEGMTFKSEPETIDGLNLAGIDVVSMANNHARNQGRGGLLYSYDLLSENNIDYVGAGRNYEEAHQAKIIEKEGIKFAFLAYTYSDGINFESSVGRQDPDVAFMDVLEMKSDVEKARKKAQVVIVSMHAGVEYKNYPNAQQKEFAREAINAGAKLVIGHHPHVVQSIEQYNDGFIIYSLGNMVFDQMWSKETKEGVIAKCKFIDRNLKQVEFMPVIIEDYNQPRLAGDLEAEVILERMNLEESIVDL